MPTSHRLPGRCATALIALAAAGAIGAPAAQASDPDWGALGHAGRWLTDPEGRVIVSHGTNATVKSEPYDLAGAGFGDDDAAFLKEHGFNTVRVNLSWRGIEPTPGTYDDALLGRIRDSVRLLSRHGIGVLLDAHQDQFNPKYRGNGFPDWAINDDGLPNPRLGFPSDYFGNPALQRSYDHFWANDPAPGDTVGVQDRNIAMWKHVAGYFAGEPGIIGYDPMNEPFAGSAFGSCFGTTDGCAFETNQLSKYMQAVTSVVRQQDGRRLVFYEPHVGFDFGSSTSVSNGGDPHSVFNFHSYCAGPLLTPDDPKADADCETADEQTYQNAETAQRRTGDGLFMSEFGAGTSVRDYGLMLAGADDHMISWQQWEYSLSNETGGPVPADASSADKANYLVFDQNKPPAGDNVSPKLLGLLVRAYPQAVAGTPTSWHYDPASKAFELQYSTARAGGGQLPADARTEVLLPKPLYTEGYTAQVQGARVVSDSGAGVLELVNDPGASQVTLSVTNGAPATQPSPTTTTNASTLPAPSPTPTTPPSIAVAPPAPSSAPARKRAPKVRLTLGAFRVLDGRVALRVSCPRTATAVRCSGTVSASGAGVRFARSSYTLRSGQARTVRLAVPQRLARRLSRSGRVTVRLSVVDRVAGLSTTTTRRTARLHAPR